MFQRKNSTNLIERILDERNRDDARQAWEEFHRLPARRRRRLLSDLFKVQPEITSIAARYLLKFGYWLPDETLSILSPFALGGNPVAWQVLVAQLSRVEVFVGGERCHPLTSVDEIISDLSWRPSENSVISSFVYSNLLRADMHLAITILEAMAGVPSLAGLRMLVRLVSDQECNTDRKLVAAAGLKAVAEWVSSHHKSEDWAEDARALAGLVSAGADWGVRYELVHVFQSFPIPEGAFAARSLRRDAERTGIGSAYLTDLNALIAEIEGTSRLGVEKLLEELPADEVAHLLLHVSRDPECEPDGLTSASLADGSRVDEPNGSSKAIRYSPAVINTCLGLIQSLDNHDSEWCDRYVSLLTAAVAYRGPADPAMRCLGYAASRALRKERLDEVLRLLQRAVTITQDVDEITIGRPIAAFGQAGISAGQRAERRGQVDLAASLYWTSAQLGDKQVEGGALLSLGMLHVVREDWSRARTHLEQASRCLKDTGDQENLATCLMELGLVEMEQGDFGSARERLNAAVALCEPLEAPDNYTALPHGLANLAELGLRDGSVPSSHIMALLDRALDLATKRKDPSLQNLLLHKKEQAVGRMKFRLGEGNFRHHFARALSQIEASQTAGLWESARTELREAEDLEVRAELNESFYGESGLWGQALALYVDAYTRLSYAETFEVLRHSIRDGETAQWPRVDDELVARIVRLLVREGDIDWALEIADRAKSRSLLYLCRLAGLDVLSMGRDLAPLSLLEQIRDLTMQLGRRIHAEDLEGSAEDLSLHIQLRDLTAKLPPELRSSLGLGYIDEDYEAQQREKIAWREYALGSNEQRSMGEPPSSRTGWLQTSTLSQIESLLSPRDRLIEYYLSDKGSYVFVLAPDGMVEYAPLDISPSRLDVLVSCVTSSPPIDLSDEMVDWKLELGELFDGLIRPIRDWIPIHRDDVARLIIVPHGCLTNLPFAPLWDSQRDRYLVEDAELVVVPSYGLLDLMHKRARGLSESFTFSGLANAATARDDLPEAEHEVMEILSVLPSKCRVQGTAFGSELTRSRFLELCEEADIIHYAGHIVFVPDAPMATFMPLAPAAQNPTATWQEDRLTCADLIEQLRLKSALLFLNGCESGRSELRGQQEIVGLLRTALFCGATNIIYSLWSVPDTPVTVSIVKDFYNNYVVARDSCAKSLRKAMIARRDLHPWLWAGFQLAGVS